ncbi:MAG: recombinase family protein [Chloroflexota bacterium]|nr:recombinase family protein [Chloroflexota bacterium]
MGTNQSVRAVIYLRQSKDVEGTRAAVDRQAEDCNRLCERMGWQVVRVLTDNDTWATNGKPRPGYVELFREIEAGACDVVVAWAQDRLLRDVREGEDLIDLVERTGVRIVTCQGGDHDLSTPDGRMHVRMMAVIAKGEVEKKAARQRRQARQAAEHGHAPSRRAFGYRLDGSLDPEEAPVVRRAFYLLFEGASLVRITDYLNGTGLVSVRGNRWHRKGVGYMLQSPRYAGWRVYHAGQPDELRTRGSWPTIVTDEEHEKAVALLTDPLRKPAGHRGTARRWLGAGLFVCGRCAETGTMDAEGHPVTCGPAGGRTGTRGPTSAGSTGTCPGPPTRSTRTSWR